MDTCEALRHAVSAASAPHDGTHPTVILTDSLSCRQATPDQGLPDIQELFGSVSKVDWYHTSKGKTSPTLWTDGVLLGLFVSPSSHAPCLLFMTPSETDTFSISSRPDAVLLPAGPHFLTPILLHLCSNVHVEFPLTLLGGHGSSGDAIMLSRRTIDQPTLIIDSKDVTLRSILFKDAGGVVRTCPALVGSKCPEVASRKALRRSSFVAMLTLMHIFKSYNLRSDVNLCVFCKTVG